MLPYIGEFLGTMILILLGCGVCCNVNLDKSGMKGGGTVQITLAWVLRYWYRHSFSVKHPEHLSTRHLPSRLQ